MATKRLQAEPEVKQKIIFRYNEEDKRVEKLYGTLEKNGNSPEDVIAKVLRHKYLSGEGKK